jgi:hypothetical protein
MKRIPALFLIPALPLALSLSSCNKKEDTATAPTTESAATPNAASAGIPAQPLKAPSLADQAAKFGFDVKGAVMASDAFFPFPDCVEIAGNAGIKAIIQPGGSIRDQDSKKKIKYLR